MLKTIPQSIKRLHELFKSHNKSLFVVGGSVRDYLLKQSPKDFDLATEATPDKVIEILEKEGFRFNLQGKTFGVVVVYTDDGDFEIATFREDIYGEKLGKTRDPEVKFSTIDKDVLRRDLTFNALFYDLDKKDIIDLVDGKKDIKDKITRFVGEPKLRIEEDPLRILRLLRFSERYVFSIEKESGLAITQNALMLSLITKERIWEEIRKAYIQSKRFTSYLNKLVIYGVTDIIFQGMYISELPVSIWQMIFNSYKDLSLELHFAYLFKDNSTVGLLDKMKFTYKMEHDFARKVIFFIELLSLTPEKAAELNKKMEICGATQKEIKKWYKLCKVKGKVYKAFLKYKPSVSATELMEQGFKNKALGLEIKRLELESFKTILKKC